MREQITLLRAFLTGTDLRKIALRCALGLLAAACIGYWAAGQSPEVAEALLQQFMDTVQEAGVVDDVGNFSPFGLLKNNWTAMLTIVAYGFLPFIFFPVIALLTNGVLMGVLASWYHSQGMGFGLFLAGILPHGVFELSALVLSTACGMTLCRNMNRLVTSSPDRVPMVELFCDLLRVLLLVVAPLTVAAAFIEAYVTPIVMGLFM